MTAQTIDYAGTTLGTWQAPSWLKAFIKPTATTSLNTDAVAAEIAAVVLEWDSRTPAVLAYPRNEVAAVHFIQDVLRLPRGAVLAAVGIAEKSFYNWTGKGNQPRASSTGNLWPMTRVLHALAVVHPQLASWYHSSPQAQQAFQAGDANALAIAESTWALRCYAPPVRSAVDFDAVHDVAPTQRPARIRRTARRTGRTRPRTRTASDGD